MKKLLLPMMMMATMFACKSPETKTAETTSTDDKESGSFVSIDDKATKFKQLLDAAMKNDTAVYRTLFADTLVRMDGMAGNVDSLNNLTPS